MKQKRKRFAAALMLWLFLIPNVLLSIPVGAVGNDVIRVGLYTGSSCLSSANLLNENGSGYRFGIYGSDGSFTTLAATGQSAITMMKDHNIYLSGGTYSASRRDDSDSVVGCWHLRLEGTFESLTAAALAAEELQGGFPAWVDGDWLVCFGSYETKTEAQNAASAKKEITTPDGTHRKTLPYTAGSGCIVVTATGTTRILYEFEISGQALGVQPICSDGEALTWFKGRLYYGGFEYSRPSGNDLQVVNVVAMERYVAGVVAGEVYPEWPMETLKAAACAARTFAKRCTKHSQQGFDVCASTCCQAYVGIPQSEEARERVLRAAEETAGECIRYNGELIEALYSHSNGGIREAAVNAWGVDLPYLTACLDPFESLYECSYESAMSYWEYEMSVDEVTELLQRWGWDNGRIVDIRVTEFTEAGCVNALEIEDENGRVWTRTGDDVRLFESASDSRYFSRKFTVIAPGETGVFIKISAAEENETSVLVGEVPEFASKAAAEAAASLTAARSSLSSTARLRGSITVEETLSDTVELIATAKGYPDARVEKIVVRNDSENFLFVGSGWGHNLGMSQCGAKAMADLGYTYRQILDFYYPGTTVG